MSYWINRDILITGGAGFIGSHLTEKLVELEANVRVIDNLERGKIDNLSEVREDIQFIKGDLTHQSQAIKACKDIDIVFHTAFKVGGIPYTGGEAYQSEIFHDGTLINLNIIEGARVGDAESLIFLSSACVYPNEIQVPYSPPIKEEDCYPALAPDYYGWSKIFGELQLQQYYKNYGLEGNIARLFNVIGKREFLDLELGHAIPVLCRKVVECEDGESFEVYGNGSQTRAFIHVDDVVEALLILGEESGKPKKYNVGTQEKVSIKEAVNKIIELSGKDIKSEYIKDAPTGVHTRWPDNTNMKSLGWKPEVSFDEALEEVYNWVEKEVS